MAQHSSGIAWQHRKDIGISYGDIEKRQQRRMCDKPAKASSA